MKQQHALINIATAFGVLAALLVLAVALPLPPSVFFSPSPTGNGVVEHRIERDLQFLPLTEWGFGADPHQEAALGTMNPERQADGTTRFVPVTVERYQRRWGILALEVDGTHTDRGTR